METQRQMKFKVRISYLVEYGKQEGGEIVQKEKLMAVTPNLLGKVVKLVDGTLGLVIKMGFDDNGLLVHSISKDQIEEAARNMSRKKVIVPSNFN